MIKHTPGPWFDTEHKEYGCFRTLHGPKISHEEETSYVIFASDITPEMRAVQEADINLIVIAPTAPHECDDLKCPGNINRQKLDLLDDMLKEIEKGCQHCENIGFHPCETCGAYKYIIRAHALQEEGK